MFYAASETHQPVNEGRIIGDCAEIERAFQSASRQGARLDRHSTFCEERRASIYYAY
jgi:hypothetical protein